MKFQDFSWINRSFFYSVDNRLGTDKGGWSAGCCSSRTQTQVNQEDLQGLADGFVYSKDVQYVAGPTLRLIITRHDNQSESEGSMIRVTL